MALFRHLLNVVAGVATPIGVTSRLYLKDQLSRCGVDVQQIPEACLQELADNTVTLSKRIADMTRRSWRVSITDDLEVEAWRIAALINGTREDFDKSILLEGEEADECRAILIRHGVKIAPKSQMPTATLKG